MLQANELRIGNWINVPNKEQSPFRIDLIELLSNKYGKVGMNVFKIPNPIADGEFIEGHPLTWELIDLTPIALTPEILEKAGFESIGHFTVLDTKFINLGRNRKLSVGCGGTPNEMIFLTEEKNKDVKQIIVLRNFDYDGRTYLHQLQNIYFNFTGKELEISL